VKIEGAAWKAVLKVVESPQGQTPFRAGRTGAKSNKRLLPMADTNISAFGRAVVGHGRIEPLDEDKFSILLDNTI